MKKTFIFFFCFIICFFSYGQESHENNPELVSSFSIGDNELQLGEGNGRSYSIRGFFIWNDMILGTDYDKEHIVIFQDNNTFSILPTLSDIYNVGRLNSNGLYGLYGINGTSIYYENFEENIFYKTVLQDVDQYEVVPFNNIVFGWNKSTGHIVSRIISDNIHLAMENIEPLSAEATRALFEDQSEVIPEGLTLDDNDRLYLRGELITRDYAQFYDNWTDVYGTWRLAEGHQFNPYGRGNSTAYIGRDNDGNWYWMTTISKNILVFDKNGIFIEKFKEPEESDVLPAVSPEGDIYTMSFDDENAYLWKIERQWGLPEPAQSLGE